MKLHFLFALFLTLAACSNEQTKQQLAQLQELQQHYEKVNTQFANLPLDWFQEKLKENEIKTAFIQNNIQDTIDKNTAFTFGDFMRLRRNIKKFQAAYEEQEKNLMFAQNQLNSLTTDVNNELIDKVDFETYFQRESKALNDIAERVEQLERWANNLKERYHQLDDFVNEFIQKNIDANYQP